MLRSTTYHHITAVHALITCLCTILGFLPSYCLKIVIPSAAPLTEYALLCCYFLLLPPSPLLPSPSPQLAAYLLVLLEHLADCATDACSSHGSSDYLPHPLLLVGPRGALNPTRVWDRLTALSLLASKMWQHGSRPAAAFVIGGLGGEAGRRGGAPLYRSLSGRPNGWGHAQDFGLVRGIFLAG
jgi:hypothetical protein